MNLDLLIARYFHNLEVLNYSPRTRASQKGYLRLFQRFLANGGIDDVMAITSQHVTDFQRWLFYEPTTRSTTRSVAGQKQVLVAVKDFFRLAFLLIIVGQITARMAFKK
jgi:site-specific recombinase XerD